VRNDDKLTKTGVSDKLVALPNGQIIQTSHTVDLPYSTLCKAARMAHVLPKLKTNSLVSVSKLADSGYTTVFHPAPGGVTVHEKDAFQTVQRTSAQRLLELKWIAGGRTSR
jgi:hypothetical protein